MTREEFIRGIDPDSSVGIRPSSAAWLKHTGICVEDLKRLFDHDVLNRYGSTPDWHWWLYFPPVDAVRFTADVVAEEIARAMKRTGSEEGWELLLAVRATIILRRL